ncbi:DUF4138 domain-containing protein [Spirosoma utsteinense]|uniref:DUF4138 domain-containing protein n=1 Tax=Spirosoma utsteinense TaxID=2585773 RepID=UPI0016464B0B|nr:DUF4138 domain-containing protein [Spirosoma utsteinense]MBC3788637.1 hypothetical protein [Spirosoma utsteinense]
MKAIITLFLLGNLLATQAQKLDTISVTSEGTTYLIFDEPISLVNLGTKAYIGKVEKDRMLFLKALSPNTEPTTLLVQAGSTLFTGYVRYVKKPSRSFYDYRIMDESSSSPAARSVVSLVAPTTSKLVKMKTGKPNVSVREVKDGIDVECIQVFNDTQRTYLKLAVKNTTTIAYVLDLVTFTYKERLPRRLRNKVAPQYEEMTPDDRIEPARIEAGRIEYFYYSLPLYSTTESGYLEMILREKVGARVITLEIPAKKIMTASLL